MVLDSGALIAVEKADHATLTVLEAARRQGQPLVVPVNVIAQVWRDGSRQARLAWFGRAREVNVETLTEAGAKAAGLLCGRAGTADVVDASVVVAARRYQATVASSDRLDLEALDPDIAVLDC